MESKPRFYFAYGSNLSLSQMDSRCPDSNYHSLGVIKNYKWIIGERGYANIIATPEPEGHVVYGMIYVLSEADEEALDVAEGVPYAYEKKVLEIEKPIEGGRVEGLVYVDVRRLREGVCREEYVGRMNLGIRDAKEKGMEEWYVEKYIRPFVGQREVREGIKDPFHPIVRGLKP